jgi:hypothetical protein
MYVPFKMGKITGQGVNARAVAAQLLFWKLKKSIEPVLVTLVTLWPTSFFVIEVFPGCCKMLRTSLASTHKIPIASASLQLWQPTKSPDIAKCPCIENRQKSPLAVNQYRKL